MSDVNVRFLSEGADNLQLTVGTVAGTLTTSDVGGLSTLSLSSLTPDQFLLLYQQRVAALAISPAEPGGPEAITEASFVRVVFRDSAEGTRPTGSGTGQYKALSGASLPSLSLDDIREALANIPPPQP